MKISNLKNLETALKSNENEIEIYGEISDTVLKSGMASGSIFFGCVLLAFSLITSAVFGILYLITSLSVILGIAIIALCVAIFSVTITITIKGIQKADIILAIKLHKYRITKKNNRIILKRKGTVK